MNYTALYKESALRLVLRMSLPSMGAQISSVIMQFIDSAMVGHLDTNAAAAVGLVGGVTWLSGGLCSALTTGFAVQAAQSAGAGKQIEARKIMHLGLLAALVLSCSMALLGLCLSNYLPIWLRADHSIHTLSIRYFNIYALSIPLIQLNGYSAGMLQSTGNMRMPGICTIAMYAMNILFNFLLIFPSRIVARRSIGSGDKKRTRELGQAGIRLGIWITAMLSVIMFCCASQLMRLLTPNTELIQIGAILLRIESFGVTLYAVHLICVGILQGRGDTFISSIMVLGCLWGIRVPLSMLLIPYMGISGAWAAMSLELSIRGIIFLLRFHFSNR